MSELQNEPLKLDDQRFPVFEGSTGGWLRAAEKESKYAIIWQISHFQI